MNKKNNKSQILSLLGLFFLALLLILPLTIKAQTLTTIPSGNDFVLKVGDGTSANDFSLNFSESNGAGIDTWNDVNSASSPTDFGPDLTYNNTARCTYENLVNLNLGKSGVDLTDSCGNSNNRLIVLESSPTRTILQGYTRLGNWSSPYTQDDNWEQTVTYTIYANGRVYSKKNIKRLNSQITSLTWYYPLRLFVDYNADIIGADESLDPLVSGTDYTAHKFDDFWMFHSNNGTLVGDITLGTYEDWAASDFIRYNEYSTSDYSRAGTRDSGPRTWNADEEDNFYFLLQFKPNDRNSNTAAAPYITDYRSPATLTMATGTAETANFGDNNTDGWNELEGTYEVRASNHQSGFTIDGTSTTKYNPNFKIHEFYPQTGSGLTTRTMAHFRLDDNAANTTVTAQIGTNGTASGNSDTLTATGAKRNRGMTLDDDGEYINFSTSDLSDWKQGTIEFWYKPNYDFNQDAAPTKYIFGTGASGSSGEIYLKHEDNGSGSNRLRFGLYDEDGTAEEHHVEIRESDYADLWIANEWTHIRLTWDANATTDNFKIYINGWYYTQYNTAESTWTTFTPPATIYFGDYQSSGTDNAEGVFDEIYIHDDVLAGHGGAPVILDTIYNTGTLTTSNNSATLTGSGTSWSANVSAGQAIRIIGDGDEQWYEVSSVDSDTQITLTRAYQGTGSSGKSYEVGGTVIVLPEVQVDGSDKLVDTNYNISQTGSAASYVMQYLANVTDSDYFEFANSLLDANLTQNSYRWYANTDAITPTDPWPVGGSDLNQNTAISSSDAPSNTDILRIRMSIQVNNGALTASSDDFKLQFGTGSTCSSVSNWEDMGTMSSTTAPWRGYNNAGVADGATISSTVLSVSDVGESYEEENNSASNPNTINVGNDGEWDWVVQANNISIDTTYCFRMVKSDGTVLDTYTNYPKASAATTTFDVSFEGGNGENFVRNGNSVNFDGERDIGAGDYRKTTWFYFSMDNVNGKTISFTMDNAKGAYTETSIWTGKRPAYSYDQSTWYIVSNDGSLGDPDFTWDAPGTGETFTQDTVYIAYGIPYTYTDAQTDITRWEASSFASSTVVLGTSVQGRDIHLLTFEDTDSPIASADKKVMWVDSRQHPMEVSASYHARGIIDFYTDASNPEAEVFRQGWILKIIPDLNADGMYLGQTRSNANGWDLNREWNAAGPNIGTEEAEVYLAHNAMEAWTTAGNSIDIFFDMHSKSSAAPGAYYGGTINTELLEDNLEMLSNMPLANFAAGSYCIDVVDSNYGTPSYTVEGPDVRWDANNYPTKANSKSWGRSWAMAAISQFETNAKIFSFHEVPEGDGADSSTKTLITAPGKFQAIFDEAKGGAMTYWYDIENQATHASQLGDLTNGIDRIVWDDGTNRNLADSTSVATTTAYLAGPIIFKRTYTGTFAGVSNYDYTLSRTIWEDGRIWNSFALTNNTGSTVDWADMSVYNSLTDTNFTLDRDNDDNTPTPGTDNWWAQIGNGGSGIKATLVNYFVSQTGGWVYDTYASAAGPPGTTYYQDADGPTQDDGATITVNWVQQIGYDNDIVGNETQIDVYSDDIANPDSPTATTGTFTEFSAANGGLKFASSNNKVVFTYTNADSYTKKKPSFILTSYTADTAPVLKINGSFLDSETGSAHATSTYIGTSYTSFVDKNNNIGYIQYLSDISSNVEMQIGNSLPTTAPTNASSASSSYTSDIELVVSWTDNASDEDGFKIQRRDDTGSGWGSYTQVGTTTADTTSWTDNAANNASNPPVANAKYQYKVVAYNIAGNASGAEVTSAIYTTPAAPTIGTPTIDSAVAITWNWTDNANFENSYRVDYVTGTSTATDADGLDADATSWQDTDLTPNTAYSVHVHAYQSDREESPASSNSSSIYTLANIPSSLNVSANSQTQITGSWNANSNPSGTEYYIENTTAGTNSGWITDTSWESTGLICGTTYEFKVKSRNTENTETSYTSTTSVATDACATAGAGPAASPPVVVGTGQTNSSIGMGQTADIGTVDTGGINVLAYINSQANFSTVVSNNKNHLSQKHSFEIIGLDLFYNIVTVQINSVPKIAVLKLDESKKIDLDGDNIKDIEIKFENVYINRIELTIASLLENKNNQPISLKDKTLIKYSNSPKVYLLENNKKRWIVNAHTFISLGYKWENIITIPKTITYSSDEDIQLDKNNFIFSRPLSIGSLGDNVRKLQTLLKQLGYFTYKYITGYFGPITEKSVQKFQLDQGIVLNKDNPGYGYVGPKTRAKLNNISNK